MSENEPFRNSTTEDESTKPPYYPPPNEAFWVLVAALASALIAGTFLIDLGKIGAIFIELLFILPPLIYLRVKHYSVKQCFRWNGISIELVFSTLLLGISLIILLDEIDRIFNMFFPMPVEALELLSEFLIIETSSDYLFLFLGAVIFAAVCEESLFRGFIQLSMEAYGSVTKAVLFSALLFALAHFNPWWLVQILILGVFLGFVSWRANSVLPAILIHGVNNALALWMGNTSNETEWNWYSSGDHVSPSVLIAAAAGLFLGIKFFLRQTEHTFPQDIETDAAPEG
jgi:membrane protease YdiL (CAAX protease family)